MIKLEPNKTALFTVTQNNGVFFQVKQKDGHWGFKYTGENRVTVTRFCIACLKEAMQNYEYLCCVAYNPDGKSSLRKETFLRLGFTYRGEMTEEGEQILEWGGVCSKWERWNPVHQRLIFNLTKFVTSKVRAGYKYVTSSEKELVMEFNGEKVHFPLN